MGILALPNTEMRQPSARSTETLFYANVVGEEIVLEGTDRQQGQLAGIKSHSCVDKALGENYPQQSPSIIHGLSRIH